jgi:hypothetical protein
MVTSNRNGITSCSNATSHDSSRKEASKKFPVRREKKMSGQPKLHGHASVTYKLVTLTNTQVPGTVECPAFTESHLTSPTARMSAFTEKSSSSPEDVRCRTDHSLVNRLGSEVGVFRSSLGQEVIIPECVPIQAQLVQRLLET